MKKKLILALLALSVITLIYQVIYQWPDNYLRITFCDVGQGDATLISHKFSQVLIDGGPDDKVLNCLEENMPYWDSTLDLVVATHADKDHVAGLNSVLQSYEASLIMTEISSKNTSEVAAFNDAVTRAIKQGSIVVTPRLEQRLSIGQKMDLFVLWPLEENKGKKTAKSESPETMLSDENVINLLENSDKLVGNDRSIVLNMQFGKFLVFLPGDLEKEGEQALVEKGLIEDVDVLKTPHHGSKTSTTPELIEHLRPEITVISSGKNNQFGHPAPQVLATLAAAKAVILRTDQRGSITFASDGVHYWLE